MKPISKLLFCLVVIIFWADLADAQINLQRRFRHRKHKNIYLQDNSSQSETSVAAGLYGTMTYLMPLTTASDGSPDPTPSLLFGGTFKGSYHFAPKSYFDVGFGYYTPATKSVDLGNGETFTTALSAYEITFHYGYDFVGSIDDAFSFGGILGGSLLFVDEKISSHDSLVVAINAQQYYLNAGLTTGIKAGPGQFKLDVIYAFPANNVNGQDVAIQFSAAYLKLNLGYKISF